MFLTIHSAFKQLTANVVRAKWKLLLHKTNRYWSMPRRRRTTAGLNVPSMHLWDSSWTTSKFNDVIQLNVSTKCSWNVDENVCRKDAAVIRLITRDKQSDTGQRTACFNWLHTSVIIIVIIIRRYTLSLHLVCFTIDWVVVLRPARHKIGHFGDGPHRYGKTKPNTTKAHIHQSKDMYNNTK